MGGLNGPKAEGWQCLAVAPTDASFLAQAAGKTFGSNGRPSAGPTQQRCSQASKQLAGAKVSCGRGRHAPGHDSDHQPSGRRHRHRQAASGPWLCGAQSLEKRPGAIADQLRDDSPLFATSCTPPAVPTPFPALIWSFPMSRCGTA